MIENKENKKAEKQSTANKQDDTEAKKAEPVNKNEDPSTGSEDESSEEESYLKDLMAISGHGGLFRFISQGRNGIIVESIETGKRMQAFSTMKVSALEDIAIYTEEDEVKFEVVVATIHKHENGKETISPKSSPDELKDYFSNILPEYDRERVYVSDIKKILSWYNLLLKYDLIKIEEKSPAVKPSTKAATQPAAKKEADKDGEKVSG